MQTKQEWAEFWEAQGLRVFPLQPGTKDPMVKWGSWKGSAKSWRSRRYMNANIGIAPDTTYMVLDIDTKEAKQGKQSLQLLIDQGLIRATLTIKTPSGGIHLFYKLPNDFATHAQMINRVNVFPGIDIRAKGGFVVAAGSVRDDFPDDPYKILKDIPFAGIPEIHPDLLAQLPTKQPTSPAQTLESPTTQTTSLADAPDYATIGQTTQGAKPSLADFSEAEGLISEEENEYSKIPDSIPVGGRNDALYRFASSWRERGYSKAHAEVLMEALHGRLEQPEGDVIPLSEALGILTRVWRSYTPGEQAKKAEQSVIDNVQPAKLEEVINHATRQLKASNYLEIEDQSVIQGDNIAGDTEVSSVALTKPEDLAAALGRFIYCAEGNCVIDVLKPPHSPHATMPIASFNVYWASTKFKITKNYKPLPKLWVEHINRQQVDAMGYKPKAPRIYNHFGAQLYNMWDESPLLSAAAALPHIDTDHLEVFHDHLDFIFGEDKAEKKLFLQWLTYAVLYPERRMQYAVLILSRPGVGKSWFYALLQKLLGQHEVNTVLSKDLASEFNSWAANCSFVVVHEMYMKGNIEAMTQLMSLITESRVMINEKSVRRKMTDIYANFLMFSNHAAAAALADNDRRVFVYRSSASKAPQEYYARLWGWLQTDGPVHLLKAMQQMDISDFDPTAEPPTTAAKADMIFENMSEVEQMIRGAIADQLPPFDVDIVEPGRVIEWIAYKQGLDVAQPADRQRVPKVLVQIQERPLPQERFRVPGYDGQLRLKCIRHFDKWSRASVEEIIQEFRRSRPMTRPLGDNVVRLHDPI